MKLSELIKHLLTINGWDISDELHALDKKLTLIKNSSKDINISELNGSLGDIETTIMNTIHDLHDLDTEIKTLHNEANDLMQEASHEPMIESVEMYEERKPYWSNKETINNVRELDLFNDTDNEKAFDNMVKKYSSWKYPAVYIRPNKLRFFNSLKASDVLYVMDQCNVVDYMYKSLTPAEFKSVHFKLIDEDKDEFIAGALPHNQIGLVVMDNFLNHKPIGIIKQYLEEMMIVLRPGGHALFTFNDCDYPSGALNFENGVNCFTPGRLVQELCLLTGFKITDFETNNRVSWIVVEKPGELKTLKGGKTLGEIRKDPEIIKHKPGMPIRPVPGNLTKATNQKD